MEEASSSQNANGEKTERARRRLSSILKAPRTPLQDLGVGNEFHQECFPEKRRKSSRRVSFAEPIKAVAAELQAKNDEQIDVQGKGTESRKSVRFEHETTDDPQSAITGMDTLLTAPIQKPLQQLEFLDGDQVHGNTTMFCDDADMDMTASNTVLISKNDFENSDTDVKSDKIDFTSFLASLHSGSKHSQRHEEFFPEMQLAGTKSTFFNIETNDNSNLENKISFSDFLSRLKPPTKSAPTLLEGDEKENMFVSDLNLLESTRTVPSVPLSTRAYPQAQEKANISYILKEKDDAVDFTQCHTTNIETFFPPNDDYPKQFDHENSFFGDTALNVVGQIKPGFEGMHSDQKPKTNSSQNIPVLHYRFENKFSNPTSSKLSAQNTEVMFDFQNKTLAFNDEMDLTKCHTVRIDKVDVQTSPTLKEKTMIFTEFEEDMDITKQINIGISCSNPVAGPPSHNATSQTAGTAFAIHSENTGNFLVDDMAITRSHSVAFEMHNIDQQSACKEMVSSNSSRNDGITLKSTENIVSEKICIRQNCVDNPQLESQDKTILFPFDYMDLTRNVSSMIELNEIGSLFPHTFKSVEKLSKLSKSSSFHIKPVFPNLKETTSVDECESRADFTNDPCSCIPAKLKEIDFRNSSGGCLGKMMDLKEYEFGASNVEIVHCTELPEKSDLQLCDRTTVFAGYGNNMDFTNHCMDVTMHVVREETVETSLQNTNLSLLPRNADVTTIFKNDDELDFTKSHTANIQAVFPPTNGIELKTIVTSSAGVQSGNDVGKTFNPLLNSSLATPVQVINDDAKKAEDTSKSNLVISTQTNMYQTNHTELVVQCTAMKHECGDETVIIDEAMDVTKIHTVLIDNADLSYLNSSTVQRPESPKIVHSEKGFRVGKGILLADFNEYMTKKQPVLNNNNLIVACHLSQNDASRAGKSSNAFSSTEDEMDITKSHTVAIDSHAILQSQMTEDALLPVLKIDQGVEDTIQEPIKELEQNTTGNVYQTKHASYPSHGRSLILQVPTDKTMNFLNEDMDQTRLPTPAVDPQEQDDLLSKTQTVANKCLPLLPRFDTSVTNFPEDMDITKSHTCFIDDQIIETEGNQKPTIEKHNEICNASAEQLKLDDSTVSKKCDRKKGFELLGSHKQTNAIFASRDFGLHLAQDIFSIEGESSKHSISIHPYPHPCPATQLDKNTIKAASEQMPNCLHGVSEMAFQRTTNLVEEISEFAASLRELNNPQQRFSEKMTEIPRAQYPENVGQSEKTILFSDSGEMDVTRTRTIAISNRKSGASGCTTETSRMDRTVFCLADDHMDITQSHTVAIDQQNMVKSPSASSLLQLGFSNEKCWDDQKMDISDGIELNPVEKASFHIKSNSQTYSVQPVLHPFQSDETVFLHEGLNLPDGFIPAKNNTDTQEMQNHDISFKSIEPTSKFSKVLLPSDSFASAILNQQHEMEMTVCNTVFIDDQNFALPNNLKCVGLSNQSKSDPSNKNGVINPNCPTEHRRVNPDHKREAVENDAPGSSAFMITQLQLLNTADVSKEIVPLNITLQAVTQNCEDEMAVTKCRTTAKEKVNMRSSVDPGADDMEVTKSHSEICIQNERESVQLSTTDLSSTRKSIMSLPIDKSVLFSTGNAMDITRSHTVGIDQQFIGLHQSNAQGFMSASSSETTAPCSKPVFRKVGLIVTGDQISLAQNNLLLAYQRSPPPVHLTNDKTFYLSEDMALTKAANIVTDTREAGRLYSLLPENTEALPKSRTLMPPPNDTPPAISKGTIEMDITKSHTVCIVGPHTGSHNIPLVSKLDKHLGEPHLGNPEMEPCDLSTEQIQINNSTTITESKPEVSLDSHSSSEKHTTIFYGECEDMELTSFTKSIKSGCNSGSICPHIQDNISNVTDVFLKVDKIDETMCRTTKIERVSPVAHGYEAKRVDLGEQNNLAEKKCRTVCETSPTPIGVGQAVISTAENIEEVGQTFASKNTKSNCLLNNMPPDLQYIASAKEYENRSEKCDQLDEQNGNGFLFHHIFPSHEQIRTAAAIGEVDLQVIVPPTIDVKSKPKVTLHTCEGSVHSKSKGQEETKNDCKNMKLTQIGSDNGPEVHVTQPHEHALPAVSSCSQKHSNLNDFAKNVEIKSDACTLNDRMQTDNKSRRCSLADLQSKLERLKRQSEVETACSSNLLNHLPLSSQMSNGTKKSETIDAGASVNPTSEELESKNVEAPNSAVTVDGYTLKNAICKMKRLPLGMFVAKLPNKRKSYVPDKRADTLFSDSETHSSCGTVPDSLPVVCSLNKGESCVPLEIAEEVFPSCLEEGESDNVLSYEVPEGAWEELHEMDIVHDQTESGVMPIKPCNRQKRSFDLVDKEEIQNANKRKKEDWTLDSREHQNNPTFTNLLSNHTEAYQLNPASGRSTTKTSSSSTSSSDSRAEGITTDLSHQSSQAESHLFMDSSDELNLHKRLQDGVITVKEFFMLLNLGVLIQRPRFSELPDNYDMNAHLSQEDLVCDRYIYRTKLQVCEEACLALSNTIEELKHCVNAQDKPLAQVNGLFWEAMKRCSESELKFLSEEMKKMKSNFTLKSKVFSHKEKVKRYGKLLDTTRIQSEKLNSAINDVNKLLEEMDSCISALHNETVQLEMSGDTQPDSGETIYKTEMVRLECCEAMLNRELSSLEEKKQTILFEMKSLQRKASNLDKYLSEYNFSEWEISEWDEHSAIFTFLYGSIELTIAFGDPVDGVLFCSKSCRRISDVTFESLLNDESAPASSLLVQRLVFQFIERKRSLLENYMTMNELPQFLFDISLVVSRCRLLGEELEFLMKWGGKFNLLKTEVHNTKVTLIFSSIEAYAKFEVLFCLSDNYPSTPLSFTVLKRIGKIGQEEISAVMSNVLQGTNYLRRAVQQIHCNLLQPPIH